jgi:hypothetical protein
LSGVAIRTGATITVAPLRELEAITGDLVIGPTVGVDEVQFDSLARVGGAIRVAGNGSLRGLFLPRLVEAGRIEVDGNVSLTTISAPSLARVLGAVVVTDNHALELLDISGLISVRKELVISGHPKLSLVEVGRFGRAESVRIEADPKLPPELVKRLRASSAP